VVAYATVVEAFDPLPDLLIGEARENVTPRNAGGNHGILDPGSGRDAVTLSALSGASR